MRILLVEPTNANTGSLYKVIKSLFNDIDVIRGDGDQVSYVRSGRYDLVIINPVYLSMDYLEYIHEIRKKGLSVPILFVSSTSTVEARIMGLDMGADDCMSRPFNNDELYSRIRALGRRPVSYFNDQIIIGDIVFNRRMHSIMKDDKEIPLKGKEFSLMEMLTLNSKQVLTKERIFDKIWGFDSDAEYNSVEVYVSFLRKKLKALGSSLKIVSVRGVGYHISPEDSDAYGEWYFR